MAVYRPPRNVFLLGITSLFNDLSSEMVASVFPAFFTSVLKTGAGALGLTEGIAEGAANLIKIYSGQWSDRVQRRKVFTVAGYALSIATRPLYTLAGTLPPVIGLRLTDRIGKGLRDGPRDAMISLSTPKEELGRAFGYHRMMDTIGAVLGPLVAFFILRANPHAFSTVFSTAFVLGLLALASVGFVQDVRKQVEHGTFSINAIGSYSPDFRRFLLALLFLSIGSLPVAVILLKTQPLGLTLASIPLMYALYNLAYAGFSQTAGSLSDRFGPNVVLRSGYLVLLAGYLIIATAENVPILSLGFVVLGIFSAMTDGVARALGSSLSPDAKRAGALGLINGVNGFGLLIAGIVGGLVWQHASPGLALTVGGCSVIAGILLLNTLKPTPR